MSAADSAEYKRDRSRTYVRDGRPLVSLRRTSTGSWCANGSDEHPDPVYALEMAGVIKALPTVEEVYDLAWEVANDMARDDPTQELDWRTSGSGVLAAWVAGRHGTQFVDDMAERRSPTRA